ncbi:hypothetical protein F2Q68_00035857 [Brassica cretica]|uniref:Sugar phosphate transporter domain-containing protein n=1 Tax=Brassica cretica TaxID=69181 RepID=A0A8S9H608_BRACR|nr:hypothetical protein F2Q68_00035857 [Brassica cretica]
MLYLATNTLERVAPLTHAVGNVLKRVFVIGFSIVIFGNKISTQTGIGTGIAIAGVALYSVIKAKIEEEKRVRRRRELRPTAVDGCVNNSSEANRRFSLRKNKKRCVSFAVEEGRKVEGPQLLKHGFNDAIAKVGMTKFISDLFWVGMFYHLYNQLATNTLERVAPLTHAVGNVLKRVFVIGFSIVIFGNKISTQTGIGTGIAIAGVALYSVIKAKIEEEKRQGKTA